MPKQRPGNKGRWKAYSINQCALYKLGSKARLADVLGVPLEQLIDLSNRTNNYRTFLLPEEICPFTGKVRKERWVQEPKFELRRVHNRILKLLRPVEAPDYAHAAIKGRSYRSNAEAHKDAGRIATFDIRKFYPSTSESSVFNFLSSQLCCVPDVAQLLVKLICIDHGLPTGSPLSPLLSLYANKPMFDDLSHLASAHGLRFTCYVDDITFSGERLPTGLLAMVARLVAKNGHRLSEEKTRLFRRNQGKHVTGTVLRNGQVLVPHSRFKKARAIACAIAKETTIERKLSMSRQLAGLLGEAAFIDERYFAWAKRAYEELKLFEKEMALLKVDTEGT